MKTKEHSAVYLAMHNMFAQNDPHSFAVLKMIQDIYPAFEKKIRNENDFMYKLVMSGYNPQDILDYPICGACEGLAAWNGYVRKDGRLMHEARCMNSKCDKATLHDMAHPYLFRDWVRQELKKKAPANVVEGIDLAIDNTCETYVRIAYNKMVKEIAIADAIRGPKMGRTEAPALVNAEPEKPKIEVHMGPLDDIKIKDLVKVEEEALENDV